MGALLLAPLAIVGLMLTVTKPPLLFIPAGDVLLYERDAGQLLAGAIPYRDFQLEYPPLALLPMSLPRLVWPFGPMGDLEFTWTFALLEAGLACLTGWLIARVSDNPAPALAAWVALVLVCATPLAWRYDLWPAMLVLVAVVAADRGRPGLSGAAIGAGVMFKLFPLVVLPILAARAIVLREWVGLGRLVAATAAVIAAIFAASFAVAGPAAFGWLGYELDRGLQLESTGSGLLLLLHAVAGTPATTGYAFGSMQVTTPGADGLTGTTLAALPILTAAAIGLVSSLALRRFGRDRAATGTVPLASLVTATVAVLVALILTSKVFSVQYVIWFLPLVPLLAWPKWVLTFAIAGVSALVYPANYTALWHLEPAAILALNLRNLLLLGLLAWLLAELAGVAGVARGHGNATGPDEAWQQTRGRGPLATA